MQDDRSGRLLRDQLVGGRESHTQLGFHSGQELEKVSKDMDRDYFMSSQEAQEYGIIDTVIVHRH